MHRLKRLRMTTDSSHLIVKVYWFVPIETN
ncbi:hypothetical protein BRC2024_KCUCJSVR_CDS_0165 [Acinetobacter phage vB_AbaM_KissB]